MPTLERERLAFPPPPPGSLFVNDHVSSRTEGTQRVISVHGVVFAHYDVSDRVAEAYALVTLVDLGYADQNDLAGAFGYSTRSLRRYRARVEAGGLGALGRPPGRPAGRRAEPSRSRRRDETMLRLKTTGLSNRAIAGRLGFDEKVVRRCLHRVGWRPSADSSLPFQPETEHEADAATDASASQVARPATGRRPPRSGDETTEAKTEPVPTSLDRDPLNRSMERLLAAMGVLEDAAPLFARAPCVPRAGVLLAIPSLVGTGVLSIARTIYRSIGPAFYGLRTTLVAYVLVALLRVPRPEALKEYAPADLGRLWGWIACPRSRPCGASWLASRR